MVGVILPMRLIIPIPAAEVARRHAHEQHIHLDLFNVSIAEADTRALVVASAGDGGLFSKGAAKASSDLRVAYSRRSSKSSIPAGLYL
jgi:hypothetical protein